MDLESARPKLHSSVTLHAAPEGGGVARRWETGVYMTLDADEFFLAAQFDGKKTLAQLNRSLFVRCGELRISALLNLTSRMSEANLIDNLGTPLDTTAVPMNPAARLLRAVTRLQFTSKQATPGTGTGKGPNLFAAAVLALPALGLFIDIQPPAEPLKVHGSYAVGLAVFLLGLSFALSIREIVSLWVLRSFGGRPWSLGLGFSFLVPHFLADERDIAIAGRRARTTLAAFRLAVPVVLVGLASLIAARGDSNLFFIFRDAWMLHALIATCPLVPASDLRQLLGSLMPAGKSEERSRSYLYERFLKQTLAFKNTFNGEPVYIVSALAYPVWFYAALVSVGNLLQNNILSLLHDLMLSGDEPVVQAGILVFLSFLALSAVLLVTIPIYGLFRAVTQLMPDWRSQVLAQKRKPLEENAETWRALGEVALFSQLGESALKELAQKVRREVFPAGGRVFNQGDAGDRFYSIRSGQVEVLRKDESGLDQRLAVLGAGDAFGEIALLEGGSRTASVRATVATECFSLQRDAFEEFVASSSLAGNQITDFLRLSQFLRGISLFRGLSAAEILRVLQRSERRVVAKGAVIIQEGEDGNEFYLIRRGEFSVTVKGKPVAELKAGDYFGEIALLLKTKRTARVAALGDGELLVMDREHFYDTISSNFQLGLGLEEITRSRHAKTQIAQAKA